MLHTVIQGPPGVGKTMLGYIIGKIYHKLGMI
jgi:Holliday junction resolvasome RuvABC ATP-dependent DNA helicase subunit